MGWKFKEKNVGTIVEYHTEYDAKIMRGHPEYEEILEEVSTKKVKQAETKDD